MRRASVPAACIVLRIGFHCLHRQIVNETDFIQMENVNGKFSKRLPLILLKPLKRDGYKDTTKDWDKRREISGPLQALHSFQIIHRPAGQDLGSRFVIRSCFDTAHKRQENRPLCSDSRLFRAAPRQIYIDAPPYLFCTAFLYLPQQYITRSLAFRSDCLTQYAIRAAPGTLEKP